MANKIEELTAQVNYLIEVVEIKAGNIYRDGDGPDYKFKVPQWSMEHLKDHQTYVSLYSAALNAYVSAREALELEKWTVGQDIETLKAEATCLIKEGRYDEAIATLENINRLKEGL